jgi:hypothetical protein
VVELRMTAGRGEDPTRRIPPAKKPARNRRG